MKADFISEIQVKDGAIICPVPEYATDTKYKLERLNGKKCVVTIENADTKSQAQNKAFHSLAQCFWDSGCSSFDNFDELKAHYKIQVGHIAFTKYLFYRNGKVEYVTRVEDIPKDAESGAVSMSYPASWATITQEKAMKAITQLINDMEQAQVFSSFQGEKFAEIIFGMTGESWYKEVTKC